MGWQPISTAPMNGTWVLLRGGTIFCGWEDDDNFPPCVVGRYFDGQDVGGAWLFSLYENGFYGEYENPTEWMPTP